MIQMIHNHGFSIKFDNHFVLAELIFKTSIARSAEDINDFDISNIRKIEDWE